LCALNPNSRSALALEADCTLLCGCGHQSRLISPTCCHLIAAGRSESEKPHCKKEEEEKGKMKNEPIRAHE